MQKTSNPLSKKAIASTNCAYISKRLLESSNSFKELFSITVSDLSSVSQGLCHCFADFFVTKVDRIRQSLAVSPSDLGPLTPLINTVPYTFYFQTPSLEEVVSAIKNTKPSGSIVESWPSTLFSTCSRTLAPDLRILIAASFSFPYF